MITATVAHPGWEETHATIPGPLEPASLSRALGRLPDPGRVVAADIFGTAGEISAAKHCLLQHGVTAPPTCVLSSLRGFGGLQLVCAAGCRVTPLAPDGAVAGFLVHADDGGQVFLGGIHPPDIAAPRASQARDIFALMEKLLGMAGLGFADVARTWFYNDRILDWYPEFNAARTAHFQRQRIRRMPASTGIGAPNPAGAALVAKAVAPRCTGSTSVETVASPLQGEAFSYGSAFSRAVMIRDARSRTLHVSGTASIDPDGRTAHQGDCAAQIDHTMRVVAALASGAGMAFTDAIRAVVYLRDPSHVPLWESFRRTHGLDNLPAVVAGCDICRDDLLFEIEVDLAAGTGPAPGR